MKILTLIIKQKWFDEIISGRKRFEYRETTYQTQKRYVKTVVDEDDGSIGYEYEMDEKYGLTKPKPIIYDAIRFYVGYHQDRDTALVRVKSVRTDFVLGGTGKPCVFGVADEDVRLGYPFFIPVQLTYELGDIIDKKVK